MKNILIASAMALGLGVAANASFAQTQPATGAQGSAGSACDPSSGNCPSAGGAETQGKASGGADVQAQGKAGANTELKAQDKAGTTTEQNAQDKSGTTTEQNAQDKSGTTTEQNAQGQTGTTTEQNAQDKSGTTTEQNAQGQTQDQNSTASITNVTTEQKTEIVNVIREEHVEPVDVDFSVSVGVEVPRTVTLHRLPARIVKIVPAYKTYEYFVLADGRIVIVDPDSLEIVFILSA